MFASFHHKTIKSLNCWKWLAHLEDLSTQIFRNLCRFVVKQISFCIVIFQRCHNGWPAHSLLSVSSKYLIFCDASQLCVVKTVSLLKLLVVKGIVWIKMSSSNMKYYQHATSWRGMLRRNDKILAVNSIHTRGTLGEWIKLWKVWVNPTIKLKV